MLARVVSSLRKASPMEASPAVQLRNRVRAGDIHAVKGLLKSGADYASESTTVRKWTALHIACWGSSKPQYDREVVEAILRMAAKDDKEQAVRAAKDAIDGKTPIELAKEKRETLSSTGDEAKQLEEKRKFDKIIEWLEKGISSS